MKGFDWNSGASYLMKMEPEAKRITQTLVFRIFTFALYNND